MKTGYFVIIRLKKNVIRYYSAKESRKMKTNKILVESILKLIEKSLIVHFTTK